MRVLATGVTKQQCGGGTSVDYEPVAALLVKALRAAGHGVDHRVVGAAERLDGYDAVLVGLVPFFSIASHHLYPALHVLSEARRTGRPIVLYVDDWGFSQLIANLGTHLRQPHQLTKEFFKGRLNRDWALSHEAELMEVVRWLGEDPWPPLLVPTFRWGNHEKLGNLLPNAHDVTYVDPSRFARSYDVVATAVEERDRQWVLGTVSNQLEWVESLNLAWPLNHLGTRTSRAPRKMPERDLVQLYADSWGVLSPPYRKILGTGWWRNRFVYAARTRSVLLCDPGEAAQLGEPYLLTPDVVEKQPTTALRDLAHAQAAALEGAMGSAAAACAQINDAFQRARELT
jgi:hypothetical protein